MKTIVPTILTTVCAAAAFVAVQVGAQQREARTLAEFDAIEVGGGIDLRLRQSDDFRVEVVGAQDQLENVITEVRNGTLHISHRASSFGGFFGSVDSPEVEVSLPALRSLQASGGSDTVIDDTMAGASLRIDASGGSDLDANVDVDTLEVEASGGSDVRLAGTAREARFRTSGGSDVAARRLEIVAAEVRTSGGSDLEITVSESLYARASGGSDIVYYGNPGAVDTESGSSADITRR